MRNGVFIAAALSCLVPFSRSSGADVAREVSASGAEQLTIDGVGFPFDTVLELEGAIVAKVSTLPYFADALLEPRRINGKPTQTVLEVRLYAESPEIRRRLEGLKTGDCYALRCRLKNARFSGTWSACLVAVEELRAVAEIKLGPADFVDRRATFEGIAAAGGKFTIGDQSISLAGVASWPANVVGKPVEATGLVRRAADGFRLDDASSTKAKLEDRIGDDVVLDGHLYSLNGVWRFRYRDTDLDLTCAEGPTLRFGESRHAAAVRVSGKLLRQDRPSLQQISLKADRDLVPTFVVRGAKVEPREKPLSWETRFGTLYPVRAKITAGVPELFAQGYIGNYIGTETKASLYAGRNWDLIEAILAAPTSATLDTLAARMNDAALDATLRLIYAAMLARANDLRGRAFLLARTKLDDGDVNVDALYCLGEFPFLGPSDSRTKVDVGWAIDRMSELVTSQSPTKVIGTPFGDRKDAAQPVAEVVERFTTIAAALMLSEKGRPALIDFALSDKPGSAEVKSVLYDAEEPLPTDVLLKLEAITTDPEERRTLMQQLLRHPKPVGLERFLRDLDGSFVYADLRDHLTPDVVALLRPLVEKATGEAQTNLRLLLELGSKDPTAALLKLLADPTWKARNLIVYELAGTGDPRVVAPVAKILREGPADFFGTDDGSTGAAAMNNSLDAIAHTGTAEAIAALIELLDVDLDRFGTYHDQAGLQRIVAAHLIELTGESFGTDAAAWRRWRDAHPTHSVPPNLANPRRYFRADAEGVIDLGR